MKKLSKYLIAFILVILIISVVYAQSLDIQVHIQRNQIHHWVDVPVYDGEGVQIGTKEVLEFGMRCPEYPNLPTYGLRVDYPLTQQKVLDAIKARLVLIREQIERDNLIRQQIEDMGFLDFTVTIED